MSEDEIYNYLISFISSKIKQHKLNLQDMAGFNLGYLSTEELQKAVQGLMDLRKAEQEKNKKLFEEYNKRVATIIEYEQVINEIIDKIYEKYTDISEVVEDLEKLLKRE